MPVILLKDRCDNLPRCFAASVCPSQALFYDDEKGQLVILPERCGDCRGPCLNFCDHYALKYAPNLEELRLLQAELDGSLSAEAIAQERLRLKKQAEEARQKQLVQDVTSANFQQEVLQSRLPVLLLVDSARSAAAKRLAPTLEQISQKHVGQISIRRVNSDMEAQLVAALRVRSVPTFLFLYQGQLVDGVEGVISPAQLQGWVDGLIEQVRSPEGPPGAEPRPVGPKIAKG